MHASVTPSRRTSGMPTKAMAPLLPMVALITPLARPEEARSTTLRTSFFLSAMVCLIPLRIFSLVSQGIVCLHLDGAGYSLRRCDLGLLIHVDEHGALLADLADGHLIDFHLCSLAGFDDLLGSLAGRIDGDLHIGLGLWGQHFA